MDMPMSEWMNIETAPKDGTKVLVANKQFIATARFVFSHHIVTNETVRDGWLYFDCEDPWYSVFDEWDDEYGPTHWMPLPEPPK